MEDAGHTYNMEKVTISAISRKEKVSAKTNKPFTSLGLKTKEYGDKWLSGFGNKDNAGWKEGDVVELEVVQRGEYLNFETPKKEDKADAKLEQILNYLVGLKIDLQILKEHVVPKKKAYPTPESEGIDLDKTFPDEPTPEELNAELHN